MQYSCRLIGSALIIAMFALMWWFVEFNPCPALYVDMSSNGTQSARIYYDLGYGLSEKNAVSPSTFNDRKIHKYRFELPNSKIFNIRFDPPPGRTVLEKMYVAVDIMEGLSIGLKTINLSHFKPGQEIRNLTYQDNRLTITTTDMAQDPQVWMGFSSPLLISSFWMNAASLLKFAWIVFIGLLVFVFAKKGPFKEANRSNLLLFFLLGLALYLRLKGLAQEPLWFDEGYTLAYTNLPFLEMLNFIATRDVQPPLYYVLIKSFRLFGESEAWLRLPSLAFGVVAIAILWRTVRENWGVPAAFAAALLMTLSEAFIWYSQEARMYSLVLMLTTATLYYFFRFVHPSSAQGPLRSDIWGLALSTLALLLSHNVTLLFIAAQGMCGFFLLSPGILKDQKRRIIFNKWLLAEVTAFVIYLPWFVHFLSQNANASSRFWTVQPSPETITSLFHMVLFYKAQWEHTSTVAIVILMIVIARIVSSGDRRIYALGWMILFPVIFSYVYSQYGTPIFVERTLLYISVPLFIIMGTILPAEGFSIASFRINRGILCRWATGASVIVVLSVLNIQAWQGEQIVITKEDFRQTAFSVQRQLPHMKHPSMVVYSNPIIEPLFDFYWKNLCTAAAVDTYSVPCHYGDVPSGNSNLEPLVSDRDINLLAGSLTRKETVAVILAHDWYVDPQKLLLTYFETNWRFVNRIDFNGVSVRYYEKWKNNPAKNDRIDMGTHAYQGRL